MSKSGLPATGTRLLVVRAGGVPCKTDEDGTVRAIWIIGQGVP